jgi:glutamate-1-semialdehyde 2,1-aminomutase
MRSASRGFLQFLRQAADEVGAVLIFDEVITSRLHYHGMQGALDVRPDMTTLGKYLDGGFPFDAFGGSAKFMDLFDPTATPGVLHHSGTFNNNDFTMSVAVAAADLITKDSIEC